MTDNISDKVNIERQTSIEVSGGGGSNHHSLTQEELLNLIGNDCVMEDEINIVDKHIDKQKVFAPFARPAISVEYPDDDEDNSHPDRAILEHILEQSSERNNESNVIESVTTPNPDLSESSGAGPLIIRTQDAAEPEPVTTCCCFEITRGRKTEKWPPNFCYRDIVIGFFSLFTFAFDYGTDVRLLIEYVTDGEYLLFALTCGFIVVPSFVSGIISVIWYKMTYKRDQELNFKHAMTLYYSRILASFVQLGRLFRQGEYIYCVFHGVRAEKRGDKKQSLSYRKRAMIEKRDAAMLGLIDGFMESALQLMLQLYLTIYLNLPGTFPRVSSLASSWLSTALIVTTYYRANRKALKDRENVDYFSSIFYFFWRLTELGPRYLLLAITGALFQPWCFIAVPLHIIFVYILNMAFKPELEGVCTAPSLDEKADEERRLKTDAQNDKESNGCGLKCSKLLQYLFVFLMSFVGIFTYINLKDGKTWTITLIYYTVYYIENILMAVVILYFSVSTDNVTGWTYSVFALPAGMFCHAIFEGIYYGYFHPNSWNKHAPSIGFRCCC